MDSLALQAVHAWSEGWFFSEVLCMPSERCILLAEVSCIPDVNSGTEAL